MRILELALVISGCLAPLFILANEIDGDEFAKAFSGVACAATLAAIVQVSKMWYARHHGGKDHR